MPEIRVGDAQISYRDAGSGPAVIAVHCSSSHSGQWKPLSEALATRARVIAPDLHGYGRSDPLPKNGEAWFVHDANLLLALIDMVGAPVHLVGHSLGAAACVYAAVRSDQVASLCLYEPVLFPLLEQAGELEASEGWRISSTLHGLIRLGREDQASEAFVDFWSGEGAWRKTSPELKRYIIATLGRVADDWAGSVNGLDKQITIKELGLIDTPTQLMMGTATRASASKIVELMRNACPAFQLVELDGLSHMAPVTDSPVVLPQIVAWLEKQIMD